MRPFTNLKEARKGLKLPGGQGAFVSPPAEGDSYRWEKYGGYADKVFSKLVDSLKTRGWVASKSTHAGTPDGYHDTFGTHYTKRGWLLTYSKHYGACRYDNSYSITLKRIEAPLGSSQRST